MKAEIYPFVVRPLPYEYDALVPVLDEETLTFHHDKHYKTYVDNLNNALADYPELQKQSLPELLSGLDTLPGVIAAVCIPMRQILSDFRRVSPTPSTELRNSIWLLASGIPPQGTGGESKREVRPGIRFRNI